MFFCGRLVGYDLNYPVFYKQSQIMFGFYKKGFTLGDKCITAEAHFLMLRLVHSCCIMSRCCCCSAVSTVAWQQERLWVQIGQKCACRYLCENLTCSKWSHGGSALNRYLFKWSTEGNTTGCKTKSNFMFMRIWHCFTLDLSLHWTVSWWVYGLSC